MPRTVLGAGSDGDDVVAASPAKSAAAGLPAMVSNAPAEMTQSSDPDLPGATANFKLIPAGSLVIPMDNTLQSLVAPFNLKAYGLVNRLLQNRIPVEWAIRAGKAKDGVDFTATAFRVSPSATAAANLDFAGGPFIVHRDYTNLAQPLIAAFSNNVAVYQLTEDTLVDTRHELRFRPKIAINTTEAKIHTALLDFAGITNYTLTSDFSLLSNSCYTLFMEPHNKGATNGVLAARAFIEAGGNFLAQCVSVQAYENALAGHFQSTSNIVDSNSNTTNAYSNPDLPFSQFIGIVDGSESGSITDWTLGGGAFRNNGHVHLDSGSAHYQATCSKHSVGRGGLLFYLGGHDYKAGGTDLTFINGQRMILNTVFVPANRADCDLDFLTELAISKSDSATIVTNGQTISYAIVVTNQGSSLVNGATVTDLMPTILTNVTWTSIAAGGATNLNPSGSGDINATVNLPVAGTITFTVQATVSSAVECLFTNIATVAAPPGSVEIDTNNNAAVDVDLVVLSGYSNTPPVFVGTPADGTVLALATLVVTNAATDAEAPPQTLSYSVTVTNLLDNSEVTINLATIDANGVITWTPAVAPLASTNLVTTVVTDDGAPALSATNAFTVVVEPPPPFSFTSVAANPGQVELGWIAPSYEQFALAWASNLYQSVPWPEFTNVITSPTTNFMFIDDGTQTGGLDSPRFYRLRLRP